MPAFRFLLPVFRRPMLSVFLAAMCLAGTAWGETKPALGIGSSMAGSYLAGRHAQGERDLGLAADLLQPVLALDPENMDLVRRLFALLAAEGRMDEALPLAHRLIEHDGPDALVSLFVAAEAVVKGDFSAGEAALSALPSEGLSAYTKPIFLGWILQGQGKTDAALAALTPLGETDGARALYNMHAALINDVAGRRDDAARFYRAGFDDQNGSSIRLLELMASFYARGGEIEKANAAVSAFLGDQNGSIAQVARDRLAQKNWSRARVATPADGIAEGLFGLANSIRGQSGGETALFLGQLAQYLKPGFDMVQILLGEVMETDGRHQRAVEIYGRIEKDSAFYRSARLRIASAMDDMGQFERAVATLQDLARFYKNDADPLIDLGDVYRAHDDYEKAVKAYDQAFKRLGPTADKDWRLLYARGIALERTGAWARAEKDFLAALEREPDQPFILNYLGYSWIDQGLNLDRALEMIRKAVSLRPTDGYIVDSLGWGLFKTGNFAEAVREMERAVELRPQDPIINDHLGDAYWQVGRKREARFQWRRALSLDPDQDLIETIEKKLKSGLSANNG